MLILINLLWIINTILLILIIAFIALEYMNKDYPNREKIKKNVKKYIDLVLNKLKIKLDEKYKNYTLFIIPILLYTIISFLTNIYVNSQVNDYKKQAQDAVNQAEKQINQVNQNVPKEYKDMINK